MKEASRSFNPASGSTCPVMLPAAQVQRIFRRFVANWAQARLEHAGVPGWVEPDPACDYRDRDWSRLYVGDILDD